MVEDGDGHGVADRDEVTDVDEGVDGGDVAVLGKSSEQRFGCVAVLGRFSAESGEGAAPGGDLWEIRYRGRLQPFGGGSLFGPVLVEQRRWAWSVGQPGRVDDPGANRWVTLGDRVVVSEHGDEPPCILGGAPRLCRGLAAWWLMLAAGGRQLTDP